VQLVLDRLLLEFGKTRRCLDMMGPVRRTTQNLKIVQVRQEDGVLLISGSVPGHNGAYVTVRPALKRTAAK
jgi:large subunit ribosomal protein L3